MEEIEVGEYVRTKDGEIHKIMEINNSNDELWTYYKFENNMGDYKEKIVKHSKNLIDLIEKGDYVNGERVLVVNDIITDGGEKAILVENYDEWTDNGVITNKDIKSIVTHEQFAQIEYKVED